MDNFSTQIILILLTALGGGFFGAYFQNRFQHKKDLQADIHELKRKRYGAILIQMLTVLDPKRGLLKVKEFRPDFENLEDVKDELKTEMLNAILFANDEVIKLMSEFTKNPTHENYIKSAAAMRKDLWGNTTKIDEKVLGIFGKS